MKARIGKFLLLYSMFGFYVQFIHAEVKLRVVDSDHRKLNHITAGVPFKIVAEVPDTDHQYQPLFQTLGPCMLLDQNVLTKISSHLGYQKVTQNYIFTLRCDEVGALTLGPIIFESAHESLSSEVLHLDVDPPKEKNAHEKSGVFLQAITEKKRFYVGEKITIYLAFFSRNPRASQFEISLQHKLPDSLKLLEAGGPAKSNQKIDGAEYEVRTWQINIKPTSAGKIVLPAFRGTYIESASWFLMGMPEARSVYSDPLLLDVYPLPPHKEPVDSVGSFSSFTVSIDKNSVEADQAVSLKYVLKGRADFNAINLHIPVPDEIRYFQAPITLKRINGNEELAEFEYILQPKVEGTYIIPAQNFVYFDTVKETFATLTTDPIQLVVFPSSTNNIDEDKIDEQLGDEGAEKKAADSFIFPIKRVRRLRLPGWLMIFIIIVSFFWAQWTSIQKILQRALQLLRYKNAFIYARHELKRAAEKNEPETVYTIFLKLFTNRLMSKEQDITEAYTENILINKGMNQNTREKWHAFFKQIMAHYFAKQSTASDQDEFFNQAQVWIDELEKFI